MYNNIFEQIKDRINLVEYVSKYVRLRPMGGRHTGLCPFHAEKTPSFSIDGNKQVFHCFGCLTGGDLFDFYMLYHHVEKKEALRALADLAGISLSTGERRKNMLDLLNEFFVQNLQTQPAVQKILHNRGLDAKSIDKFQLGLVPDEATIARFLSQNKLNLSAYGFNDYSWKMFEHRIIFPIYDANGMLCSFGGRIYKPNDTRAKYINGPASEKFVKSKTLYGFNFAKSHLPIYVVEGYIDVIIMHQHGYCAVAPMGTAFGADHLQIVLEKSREVIVAMDADAAGKKSALKTAYTSIDYIKPDIEIKFIDFPNNHDAASYLQEYDKLDGLKFYYLYEYIFMYEYLAAPALTPEKTAQIFNKLMALTAKIKDPVLKSEYRKRWKDLWWNRDKKIKELAHLPDENSISLLLFKYILLYPDILDEVSEQLARIEHWGELSASDSRLYAEQAMNLLNGQQLDENFIQRINSLQLIEAINSRQQALEAWYKVAEHIQQTNKRAKDERAHALETNFCEQEWEKFRQMLEQQEKDREEE